MRFLIVEDDPDVVKLVNTCLRMRWPDAELEAAAEGKTALDLAKGWVPDLVVLDLGLAGDDGVDVLHGIRRMSNVPVVILTANDDQAKRVLGLEAGADDYILKPFNYAEFLARVNAVLRRAESSGAGGDAGPAVSGALMVDVSAHRVVLRGEELHFTPMEWSVFTSLWRCSGEVVTIKDLSMEIWETAAPQNSAIKTVVRRLRMKLEQDPSEPTVINSIRGLGYRFDPPE
ncbi:MAG: response regulator transcription factor [Chloroflexi bacterium]|nr:response regulator transcription factor [Chloroflexota bacterium]